MSVMGVFLCSCGFFNGTEFLAAFLVFLSFKKTSNWVGDGVRSEV